jgi:hypothetical protein
MKKLSMTIILHSELLFSTIDLPLNSRREREREREREKEREKEKEGEE